MEDFEELVTSLTPRERSPSVDIYQNTVGIACPACEEPFDDMIVSKEAYNRLNLSKHMDICATTHEGDPVLFTHRKE